MALISKDFPRGLVPLPHVIQGVILHLSESIQAASRSNKYEVFNWHLEVCSCKKWDEIMLNMALGLVNIVYIIEIDGQWRFSHDKWVFIIDDELSHIILFSSTSIVRPSGPRDMSLHPSKHFHAVFGKIMPNKNAFRCCGRLCVGGPTRGCLPRGGYLPRRVSAQGGICPSACWDTSSREQNHKSLWKHNLATTTLRTVIIWYCPPSVGNLGSLIGTKGVLPDIKQLWAVHFIA